MPRRLATGGLIDRSAPLSFSFDGKVMTGFAGDTLASALLANGVRLVGRSFKYHRPRGIMTAGVEEPNGLVTVGEGPRQEPNIPATMTELTEGLTARSQNGWPSLAFDLMAMNSLFKPLLAAGFYYKTFMGPTTRSWMVYEPLIRRAAGLGVASREADPDRYETRHLFCDVLVIGGGPAGVSAASAAAESGGRVVLVEQDSVLGKPNPPAQVTVMTRTTALGIYDGSTVPLLERCVHGRARQVLHLCRAKSIVYACGATERPLVFANNDRPGVMLASAAWTYLTRFAVLVGERIVIATNNDSAYAAACDLARAGAAVTLADQRREASAGLADQLAAAGVAHFPNSTIASVDGGTAVKRAQLLIGGQQRQFECDAVLVSGGWSPNVHLTSHGGIKPVYRDGIGAFVPGGYAPGHSGVGAITGAVDIAPPAPVLTRSEAKAFVDFQNDVTVKDIEIAHQEGYHAVEHLKRYTTLGMGTDQGKTSNINAIGIMAGLRGLAPQQAGTTTFRPPYTGVAIGALAGRSIGVHFRPTRRSPLHDWHAAHGAEFIQAGPWLRAWYYRWAGPSPETAYIEEMKLVRRGVGLADVSTLGKIDVQGPDAAEFLNRVYVNGFAKLPVGRARYGVMLTDDGVVLDDGTTTRLSETRYFMTTTTAQAGEVMSWLEFLLQAVWPELRVHVTSVTDQWAAMAVSGPQSRAALELAFPGVDVSNAALPHMGCLDFSFEGQLIRLIRLSFSGELAYEVYVAADRGIALWEHILQRASPLGIKPFGLEALASLRIEKGHVAGLELDHRNTLDDLGLGKMAAKEKPYIGRVLRQRPLLQAPERWSLIGLELLEPGYALRGGSILFAGADRIEGHGRGYITSVTWSTELNRYIALGLYQGGLKHQGDEIVCAYPLKGEYVRARIVSPHFIDQDGSRLHG